MRTITCVLLTGFLAFSTVITNAQGKAKFAHINSNELLEIMPGKDSVEKRITQHYKSLEKRLQEMKAEYDQKLARYIEIKDADTISSFVKQSIEEELMTLQTKITEYQTNANKDLANKESEWMEPLISKAKNAIDEVAREKGYTYVFDTGTGVILYESDDSENILPLVKQKLGIQ